MVNLQGYSLKEFARISECASPRAAISRLGVREFGVIHDAEQRPVAMISQYHLKQVDERGLGSLSDPSANLPPTVVALEDVRITDLLDIDILPVFSIGTPGVVLVSREWRAVAVLPLQNIIQYLSDRTARLRSGENMSLADTLPEVATSEKKIVSVSWGPAVPRHVLSGNGDVLLPTIVVRCARCGWVNRLACFDPGAPPKCESRTRPEHCLKLPQKCLAKSPLGF